MDARRAVFGSADVQKTTIKIDLIPPQCAKLAGTQTVTIGDQDHRGVAVTVTSPLPCAIHEPVHFFRGQVLTWSSAAVGGQSWRNCPVYNDWRVSLVRRFHTDNQSGNCGTVPFMGENGTVGIGLLTYLARHAEPKNLSSLKKFFTNFTDQATVASA
jgi:hypothetical protein